MARVRQPIDEKEVRFVEAIVRPKTRQEPARVKLVDKYERKYFGKGDVYQRAGNRRNITRSMRVVVSEILRILFAHCPFVTGYGAKHGIQYVMVNKNKAEIIVGGLIAPYLVHLAYPVSVAPSDWVDWLDDAYNEILMSPILQDNVILSDLDLHYGWATFSVTLEDE